MATSIKVFVATSKIFSETHGTFVGKQIKIRLVSKVVSQPVFNVFNCSNGMTISEKLKKRKIVCLGFVRYLNLLTLVKFSRLSSEKGSSLK